MRPIVKFLLLAVFIALALTLARCNPPARIVCKRSETVKSILELMGRDAVVLLSNDEKLTVNQASLKPGDTVCAEWGKNERAN